MKDTHISPVQRAFMNDPEGFRRRMELRAAALYEEGYRIRPGDSIGLFTVTTPNAQEYTVNGLAADCSCPFQQKAEIPQVPCKHILGLEKLVVDTLSDLWAFAELGDPRRRTERMAEYRALHDHWQATLDAVADRQAEEYADEEDSRQFMQECLTDRQLRD